MLEWAIFGTAILVLWCSTLSLARGLLAATAARSWSLLVARRALSGLATEAPPGVRSKAALGREGVSATVEVDGRSASTALRLEPDAKARSPFPFLFSGFRSSPFSE